MWLNNVKNKINAADLLKKTSYLKSCYLFLILLLASPITVSLENSGLNPQDFAIVNGERISLQEFETAYQAGVRKRFYHGKIPKEKLDAFKQEVSQTLIDRLLLIKEARRQNIQADEKEVESQLAQYKSRYQDKSFWQQHKDSVISGLTAALSGESILRNFEKQVKDIPLPSGQEAQSFYQKNKPLFTTPEKTRVSLILLKVSPASPASVWAAAKEEADDIIKRIKNGVDFAELARIHSGDASAASGGDMGFVHQGMLAKPAQDAINRLKVGEISQAVMLLRGVAIFRLEENQVATLNEFENVQERAQKLLQREKAKYAWNDLIERLRSQASIEINTAAISAENKT